jgi:hypothetical protein
MAMKLTARKASSHRSNGLFRQRQYHQDAEEQDLENLHAPDPRAKQGEGITAAFEKYRNEQHGDQQPQPFFRSGTGQHARSTSLEKRL